MVLKNYVQGQATTDLTQFKRVIGVDPSDSMVVGARKYTESLGVVNCEYVRSPAEDLHFLEDGSADLIVAGSLSPSPILLSLSHIVSFLGLSSTGRSLV